MKVPDLEAATALYRDVMGATVSEQQVHRSSLYFLLMYVLPLCTDIVACTLRTCILWLVDSGTGGLLEHNFFCINIT